MRAFGRDVVMNSRRYYRDRITDPRCLLITYPRGMIRVVGIPNRIAPIFPANPIEFRPLPHQIFVLFVRKGIRFSRFRFLKRWFGSSYSAESPPIVDLIYDVCFSTATRMMIVNATRGGVSPLKYIAVRPRFLRVARPTIRKIKTHARGGGAREERNFFCFPRGRKRG